MARRRHPLITGPVRTCVGCRERAARRELLRVTVGRDETTGAPVVQPDPTATAPGRGAHLHPTVRCYDLAVRRKAFPRALRFAGGLSSASLGEYVAAADRSDRSTQNRSNSS